ncbi:cellulase family glycosylhydrolase [Arenibaculum pallidiluteum]|uniref:cellulase family glycosylhydrolase n=1 Tax=Arenibaculum pallidiluteum TaxID=2812559 RepID=UPI001A977DEF|nr:cellulase family glycosylhydrolase [Arenibaculum pallidiluteum]
MRGLDRRGFLRVAGLGGLAMASAGRAPFTPAWAAGPGAGWTEAAALEWAAAQPWLVGANYVPASAANALEMWQAGTFDPARIDTELGWAASLGMNTMRVFLHDLLWQDPDGFRGRVDTYLAIAARHGIRTLFVLFDSCWDPFPRPGPQRPPRPGVHNSAWVQGPGAAALADPGQVPRLETYVTGIVGAFREDPRVLGWDVWNEPDNTNDSSYGPSEPPDKVEHVLRLLPLAFDWARRAAPAQPLTSGVWVGDWSRDELLTPVRRIQLDRSDVVTFHNYGPAAEFEERIRQLRRLGRPLICTEYMARPTGSTFETILPIARRERVGVMNWGFVAGRTQTYLPWDSWQRPYGTGDPPLWFHDVLRPDGRPYREAEAEILRSLTGPGTGRDRPSTSPARP